MRRSSAWLHRRQRVIEVVEGVQEGETVVSKGQAALKDGVKVQILNEE